ncbi:hypothetical protein NW754_009629 [Fusarium falciforme]|nr:hypothetical protein NW754_009629 [Fusarium falciforme]
MNHANLQRERSQLEQQARELIPAENKQFQEFLQAQKQQQQQSTRYQHQSQQEPSQNQQPAQQQPPPEQPSRQDHLQQQPPPALPLQLFLYSSSQHINNRLCRKLLNTRLFGINSQRTNNQLCRSLLERQPKHQQPAVQQSLQQAPPQQAQQKPSVPPAPTPPKQPHYPMPAEEPQPKGFIQQVPQQLPHLYQKQDQSAYVARWESHSTWSNPNEAEVTCQDSKSCRGFKGGSKMFMEEEEPSASHRYMAKKKGVSV